MLYKSTTFSYFSHIYISHFSGKTKRFTNTGVGTSSKSPECFTKTVPERTALDSPKINSFFFPESHVSTGGLYGLKQEEHETNKHYRSLHVIPICYRCLDYPLSWYSFSKNQNIALFMELATCGYAHQLKWDRIFSSSQIPALSKRLRCTMPQFLAQPNLAHVAMDYWFPAPQLIPVHLYIVGSLQCSASVVPQTWSWRDIRSFMTWNRDMKLSGWGSEMTFDWNWPRP